MNLQFAQLVADKVVAGLSPLCDKIAVAGSIRREKAIVGDVDIVCIPKDRAALLARIGRNCHIEKEGEKYILAHLLTQGNTIQIDVWMAHPATGDLIETIPSNFGSLFMCRTGSMEFNIALIEHAKKLGLRWHPHRGVLDGQGKLIASENEHDIFKALKLDFIPPQKRDGNALAGK